MSNSVSNKFVYGIGNEDYIEVTDYGLIILSRSHVSPNPDVRHLVEFLDEKSIYWDKFENYISEYHSRNDESTSDKIGRFILDQLGIGTFVCTRTDTKKFDSVFRGFMSDYNANKKLCEYISSQIILGNTPIRLFEINKDFVIKERKIIFSLDLSFKDNEDSSQNNVKLYS